MDLDFSHRALLSFDASALSKVDSTDDAAASNDPVLAGLLARAPPVRSLNLSHNSIQSFVGGETLTSVTALDLSHNALVSVLARHLPPTLVKLNLSHNRIGDLGDFAEQLPRLEDLDAGHNMLTSAGIRGLPSSLTSLSVNHNDIDSLDALCMVPRLTKLNVVGNLLETSKDIKTLEMLRSLRFLDIRENPIMETADSGAAEIVSVASRLSVLNGEPLSQAVNNSMYRATRAKSILGRGRDQRRSSSVHDTGSVRSSASTSRRLLSRQSKPPAEPVVELRLMNTKVAELRRLIAVAQKESLTVRAERTLLREQLKGCETLINTQSSELEGLVKELETLRREEASLRRPISVAEQTFELTHASVLAHKLNSSKDS